jgi:hypothetical protein
MRGGMRSGWMGGLGKRVIFEEGRGRRGGETKERRCGFVFGVVWDLYGLGG